MNTNRILAIINPISGTLNKTGIDTLIAQRLSAKGYDVEIAWTTGKGDGKRLAQRAIDEQFTSAIAVGGDGTVNECASVLRNSGVAMGIIPSGSGNGLARHLGIPLNVHKALKIIEQGHITNCDCGTINDYPFFCTSGVGFDAAVSAKFASMKRRGIGSYLRSTMVEFMTYKPEEYTISVNGKVLTERAFLIAICNASQYGNNAYIAPQASMTDGMLDITIMHFGNLVTNALAGVDLLAGYIYRNALVDTLRADEATIQCPGPGLVHIDGEPVDFGAELHIQCHKRALRIYTPVETGRFKPILTPMKEGVVFIADHINPRRFWRKERRGK